MEPTRKNKHFSGNAMILFLNEWDEIFRTRGKFKDEPYTVPEQGVISIRFPERYIGKQVRIFVESD